MLFLVCRNNVTKKEKTGAALQIRKGMGFYGRQELHHSPGRKGLLRVHPCPQDNAVPDDHKRFGQGVGISVNAYLTFLHYLKKGGLGDSKGVPECQGLYNLCCKRNPLGRGNKAWSKSTRKHCQTARRYINIFEIIGRYSVGTGMRSSIFTKAFS